MKILLVDDEAQVLRGVSRMIECEADDWDVDTASSGAEALELLECGTFNVIVSDMRMPGMDGAELLEAVERKFPNVLRIVLSGQADRETVLRAMKPMHQYLSKPCEPDVLMDAIRRAEVFHETISSAEVLAAIGRADCLPSLPTLVTEINRELESDTSTAKSLSNLISQDPALCARVLQLANSAIFGLRQPVVDVQQATSVLGTEMIRSLAISVAIFSPNQKTTASSAGKLFQHCLEVAGIARQLATWERVDSECANTVFSGGLLHDVGKIVLMNAFEDRYSKLSAVVPREGHSLSELELQEFGATHAGVGAYLLELWGLPSALVEVVAAHHSPENCSRASIDYQIVFAANWIAHERPSDALSSMTEMNEYSGEMNEYSGEMNEFTTRLRDWTTRIQQEREETPNV